MYFQQFEYLLEYCNYDYNKCFFITFTSFVICIFLIILDKIIEKNKEDKNL